MDNFFDLSYINIQNINIEKEDERSSFPSYNVTILRNIVIEQIEPYLQFLM